MAPVASSYLRITHARILIMMLGLCGISGSSGHICYYCATSLYGLDPLTHTDVVTNLIHYPVDALDASCTDDRYEGYWPTQYCERASCMVFEIKQRDKTVIVRGCTDFIAKDALLTGTFATGFSEGCGHISRSAGNMNVTMCKCTSDVKCNGQQLRTSNRSLFIRKRSSAHTAPINDAPQDKGIADTSRSAKVVSEYATLTLATLCSLQMMFVSL